MDIQYTALENKLKTNQYKGFYEYEKDIRAIQHHYIENIPLGPKKKEILLEFLTRTFNEGSQIFLRNVSDDMKAYKEALE